MISLPFEDSAKPLKTGKSVLLGLLEIFNKLIQIEERQVRMTANLGYALSSEHTESISELLKAAEIASKHAKPSGGNRIGAYDFEEASRLKKRYQLEHDIRSALDQDELFMLQPVIRTETGKIAGFESLIRWKHSELGEIPPSDFIPIAESNGTIIAIGDWVLAETFSCLKTIRRFFAMSRFMFQSTCPSDNWNRKTLSNGSSD